MALFLFKIDFKKKSIKKKASKISETLINIVHFVEYIFSNLRETLHGWRKEYELNK